MSDRGSLTFTLDGRAVEVPDEDVSLLEVLRDRLGVTSAKDGCSPQGQCGCCTVWVDGAPRVGCVTPARRVSGRTVTTLEGVDPAVRRRWVEAFAATGASQCGFCTPGILMRLAGLEARHKRPPTRDEAAAALVAHLCRCTGWLTILDAVDEVASGSAGSSAGRDLEAAAVRARLEGGVDQQVGTDVVEGRGGFADDTAPEGSLVAVPDGAGGWAMGPTLSEARRRAGKVQGRNTTLPLRWPVDVPVGEWAFTLQTTWVEPAYLETDASWCRPGSEPASPVANGGAFWGKLDSPLPEVARGLAAAEGAPVRVLWSREDAVRRGSKRPPLAAGIRSDGTGVVRVARTPGVAEAIASGAPGLVVEEVDIPGPPTSAAIRGAGWAEAAVLSAAFESWRQGAGPRATVRTPDGAEATAVIGDDGSVTVEVACGPPLDEVVLRSYCVGAAHMALGWVRSEGLAVDDEGVPQDLTIRSFGILRARDMPPVELRIHAGASGPDRGRPVNGSDAVFAAVAAAAWLADGLPGRWPTRTTRG